MGHTEMLLAVAGQTPQQIEDRTRQLATGDWSRFPPAEQAAFAFARKQARTPWAVTDADVQSLIDHFGPERTADVVWWSCRCHYMTRVADAFQLPLEKENVFQTPAAPASPPGPGKAP